MYTRLPLAGDNIYLYTDHHQYLSQLVLLAQIVDDEFQQSVQNIFSIDKISNEGSISFEDYLTGEEAKETDSSGDGKIKYLRYCI